MKSLFYLSIFLFFASFCHAELDKASAAQQKAVAELIQSMKSVRKVVVSGKGSGEKTEKGREIFKDKQKFILPQMPESQNPHSHLKQQIKEQKKLIEDMKKASANDSEKLEELMKKQKEIQNKTEKTASNKALSKPETQHLKQAQNAMKESGKQLQSGQPGSAGAAAQKALAELKLAEKKLAQTSSRQTQNALEDAQRKTSELAAQGGKEKPLPQTQNALRTLADKLLEDAMKQHKSGTQSNAETLAELARRIHGAASSEKIETSLAEIENQIKTLRMKDRNEQQLLAESARALKALTRQLKYSAKHPENLDDSERRQIRREIAAEADNAELAMEFLERTNGKTELSTNLARTIRRIKNKLFDLPESGSGAAHLPPGNALELAKEIDILCDYAWRILNSLKAAESVYIFNPDDVPEKYRGDVARYFERLSDTGQKKQGKKHE